MQTPPTTRGHRVLAGGTGLAVATVVAGARAAGVLPGPAALVLGVVLVAAVPTSTLLARRVLWHGAILAGAVPVLWWVDLPLGTVGRAGALLALGAGGLATWLLWDGLAGLRARARRLVPVWQVVDLLTAGAALGSSWFLLGWLRVTTGAQALAVLVPGWDHSAHYGMVRALRLYGATPDVVAAPSGQTWQFASYPQGYHALVATVMEAMLGTDVADQGTELVAYLRATALALIAAAVLITAGICALPRLRRRPAVATPVVALAVAALVVGPGGVSFTHGFVNFVVTCAFTACVALVVVGMPRVALPVPLAALGGLLVAVAHGWALLLVMALPMAAVLVLPLRRARWRADRRTWWVCGAVVAATAVGLLAAARILLVHDVDAVLVMPGGVLGPKVGTLVLLVAATFAAALWGATRGHPRATWVVAGPAFGLVAAAGVAYLQLSSGEGLSYYFWKLMIGVELVSVVVLGVALAGRVPAAGPGRSRGARLRVAAASLLLSGGATQVFGGVVMGEKIFPVPSFKVPQAEAALAAADVAAALPGVGDDAPRTVVLTPEVEHALNPLSAQQWHLGLTGRWTGEANAFAVATLVAADGTRQDMLVAARTVLADPGAYVVAPPETAEALRAQLTDDEAARVLSW